MKRILFIIAISIFAFTSNVSAQDNQWDENPYLWLSDYTLSSEDVADYDWDDLRLMRNAIYAAHGYRFKNKELLNHFSQFSWYEPLYDNVDKKLTKRELANVNVILNRERELKPNTKSSVKDSNPFRYLSSSKLKADALRGIPASELRIMRNAIFARHGYKFKNKELLRYFSSFSWYKPLYDNVNNMLNATERANIELLKRYEK